MPEKVYTTYQISKFCNVYPTTVINWIRENKLPAYKTPGGHRRVNRRDLLEFLKKYNMPIPEELRVLRKSILLIEDDPEIVRLLRRAFRRKRDIYEFAAVDNGIEALVRIGHEPPDLILLDIRIPGIDGFEVCSKLKTNPETENIRIIVITAYANEANKQKIMSHGADAFFAKPFKVKELMVKIVNLLREK